VLGSSFSPVTVAGLLDVGEHEAARRCEQVLATRLTTVAGQAYEFANDLIREVLYESTAAPTRMAHHRRAADLLADNPEAVGWHAEAAEDWPRAARGWLAAGERALRGYAVRDAESMVDRALVAAGRVGNVELEGRALLARGRAREAMGRFDDALADHAAAVRLARVGGDQRLEMRALRELGGPAWTGRGRPITEATAHLAEGLRLATLMGDRVAESDLLGWLAVLAANQLRFDDALGYGRRALAAARACGDDRARAGALDGLKSAYAYLGEIAELRSILDELEPLLRHLGDLWLMQWCVFESALPMIGTGAWDDATARIKEALAVSQRSGYTGYEAWYVAHLGWIARLSGRMDEAVAHGRRAHEIETHAWCRTAVPAMLAGTLLELGERAEAVALIEGSLAVGERHRTRAYRLHGLATLADATGSTEVLAEADAMLRTIGAPEGSAWLYGADAYVSLARAWLARGDDGRANEILAPLLAAGRRTGWTAPLAGARRLARTRGLATRT
jgi:tetratricopeptide (TPR) repeat protein